MTHETVVQVDSRPTDTLSVGQEIKVAVVPSAAQKQRRVMLSCIPSAVAAAAEKAATDPTDSAAKGSHAAEPVTPDQPAPAEEYPVGVDVRGVIDHIGKDSMSVALSNRFNAHVYCLHASELPEAAMALQEHFKLGAVVQGRVIESHDRRTSLSLLPSTFATLYRRSPGPQVRALAPFS